VAPVQLARAYPHLRTPEHRRVCTCHAASESMQQQQVDTDVSCTDSSTCQLAAPTGHTHPAFQQKSCCLTHCSHTCGMVNTLSSSMSFVHVSREMVLTTGSSATSRSGLTLLRAGAMALTRRTMKSAGKAAMTAGNTLLIHTGSIWTIAGSRASTNLGSICGGMCNSRQIVAAAGKIRKCCMIDNICCLVWPLAAAACST
jgi:hypothetical protein